MTDADRPGGTPAPNVDPLVHDVVVASGAPDDVVEMLSDYLERGEAPPAELLDRSPDHRMAYEALVRVQTVASTFLEAEATAAPARPESWIDSIISDVRRESRAGRSIPLTHPSTSARLTLTEGALRGVVRSAGDAVPGVLIGRCRFVGDVTVPGEDIVVEIDVSVFWGESIPAVVADLRTAISNALLQHSELHIVSIDLTVTDVHLRRADEDAS